MNLLQLKELESKSWKLLFWVCIDAMVEALWRLHLHMSKLGSKLKVTPKVTSDRKSPCCDGLEFSFPWHSLQLRHARS